MSLADLNAAAQEFGKIVLRPKTYTLLQSGDKTFESAIIDGYQDIPPSKYFPSVDVAVIRYVSGALGIPAGFYLLRTKVDAPITQLGQISAKSELVRPDGSVVFSCPHIADVTSIELPKNRGDAEVATRFNSIPEDMDQHTFDEHLEVTITYCCPNGMCGTCIGRACPT
jgi:hypothetical protein